MSILRVENISKRFGARRLFSDLSFVINKGQKIGLIAPNGTGKSTLLKILAGRDTADSGEITFEKESRIAYLPQKSSFSSYPDILSACISGIRPRMRQVLEEYEKAVKSGDPDRMSHLINDMDANIAWEVEQELTVMLSKLNLPNPFAPTEGLSGGENKRIALAATLLDDPDLMILDEPTNHLDPDVIEWLEERLSRQNLSLIMVTHDRYFLDKVCDTIFELYDGQLYVYEGNYSQYLEKKAERFEQMQRKQSALRNLYRRELEWMRRMPQARGGKAKYRKDAFYETESKLSNISTDEGPTLEGGAVYIGKKIFEAHNVCKAFDDKVVIRDFSYNFARRDRVGVIGHNGTGKTTLIKMILGLLEPDSGTIEVGETVRFGYFDQVPFSFPPGKKVIEVITDRSENITTADGVRKISPMQLLTKFLFPPARQQDYVEKLSGGELRRLQLCCVLMEQPNFLVLDEPTNDLDIPTLRVLEDYLSTFDGCLLIVSHDRYFLDNLVEHLFVLPGDGSVRDYPGNYTDYRATQKLEPKEEPQAKKEEKPDKNEGRYANRENKKKRSYKEQQEYLALDLEMPEVEAQLQVLEEKMSTGSYSSDTLYDMAEEHKRLQDKLDQMELRWLELSELSE